MYTIKREDNGRKTMIEEDRRKKQDYKYPCAFREEDLVCAKSLKAVGQGATWMYRASIANFVTAVMQMDGKSTVLIVDGCYQTT